MCGFCIYEGTSESSAVIGAGCCCNDAFGPQSLCYAGRGIARSRRATAADGQLFPGVRASLTFVQWLQQANALLAD
jgi:hypothetical protein